MTRKIGFTGLLAACGVVALCASSCAKKKAGPPPAHPLSVQTAPAIKQDVPVVIDAFGTTEDRLSVDLVPQVSGILTRSFVKDGAVVTNGQVLFQIDPRDYEMRVRQGESLVAADRANLELAGELVDRNQAMLEKQLIARTDFDGLETKRKALQAQLAMDESVLAQARLNLSRCTITAPLDGVCSRRFLDDGNLAAAGLTRLINIRSYDPITLNFTVSEEYLGVLRRAMAAGAVNLEIQPRGETNRYPGVLTFLDNAVSSQTGTILLRGEAPNPDLAIWSGQFISVRLVAGEVREAVMVPEGAVQFGKMGAYLFVVTAANTAELRPVKTGIRHGGLIQIAGGVEPGESVVVLGQLMLFPGAPVQDLSKTEPRSAP
jgi:multidrug efflux system membrane fusion protein